MPAKLATLMGGTPEPRARVIRVFLQMKEFDITALERANDGKE